MDEVGTPFCLTVDSDTLEDDTVTIRERDSMAQERVKISDLLTEINARMGAWKHPDS
jgi:glycyl-tRNA synthetase